MPAPNQAALDFLLTRRSRPAKTLRAEAPSRQDLDTILTAASRTPDHGKLVPWRFAVIEGEEARARFSAKALARAKEQGQDERAAEKTATAFTYGGAIVAVIASPKPAKIPRWEQELSAGAACLACLNAALALGWGANWLTGPLARDAGFLSDLGCTGEEFVAGFIHIGPETLSPADRDRPDLGAVTTWL
ncbi:MAG: nitroreductase family protein [Pseudomonadota bacterium]